MADVTCPVVCQPLWPACSLDTPDRSSSSSTRAVQDVWDVYGDELGVVPKVGLFLLLGMLLLTIFGLLGVVMLRRVYFGRTLKPEDLLTLAILLFLVEVCYEFVAGVWEAGLSVAGGLVGYIGLLRVMTLICIVPSTLLILLLLLLYSFS